ncbi:MAG TPA: hypothetical protein VKY85_05300 [Candidatus Angelobacter sp.]|nr:hypothetical protein [Candidatus Angelobacter sp.]
MIDMIFLDLIKSLVIGSVTDGLQRAFRAMVEQEIETLDPNRLITQPLRTGFAHLRKAEVEPENTARQQEFLNYAMLEFTKAADQDAPLPAARATCYAGFCHHLLHESRQETACYETFVAHDAYY